MKGEIYILWHPDDEEVVGYRWKIETYKTTIVRKHLFATRQSAERSCENYIKKHNLGIGVVSMGVTTDFDFLV